MRRFVRLTTERGDSVPVSLENWGSGVDRRFRRWVLDRCGWRCIDTGELGHPSSTPAFGLSLLSTIFQRSNLIHRLKLLYPGSKTEKPAGGHRAWVSDEQRGDRAVEETVFGAADSAIDAQGGERPEGSKHPPETQGEILRRLREELRRVEAERAA